MRNPQDSETNHGWGIISHGDVALFQRLLLRAISEFPPPLKLLEIGICGGETSRAIYDFVTSNGGKLEYHGMDVTYFEPFLPDSKLYCGDSQFIFDEVKTDLHILFIDGCHCVNHAMLDFLHYSPKVVVGGYVLFHDTNPAEQWQGQIHHGHGPHTPSFGRAVREALKKLGLINGYRTDWQFVTENASGIAYGSMLFKKLK